MRIGVDIDNVISNFNESLLNEFLEYDKTLENKGIINKDADYITRGMFDWTEEVSCPNINKETSYELTSNRHNITFVTKINKEKVYEDLFRKLRS